MAISDETWFIRTIPNLMPAKDETFKGVIGRTIEESVPDWPEPASPAEGSPNVVFILLDDTGFGHFGCYGSNIDTPNFAMRRPHPARDSKLRWISRSGATRTPAEQGVPQEFVDQLRTRGPEREARVLRRIGLLLEYDPSLVIRRIFEQNNLLLFTRTPQGFTCHIVGVLYAMFEAVF